MLLIAFVHVHVLHGQRVNSGGISQYPVVHDEEEEDIPHKTNPLNGSSRFIFHSQAVSQLVSQSVSLLVDTDFRSFLQSCGSSPRSN